MPAEEREPVPGASRRALLLAAAAVPAASLPLATAAGAAWAGALEALRAADARHVAAAEAYRIAHDQAVANAPPFPDALIYRWRKHGEEEVHEEELRTLAHINHRLPDREWCAARRAAALAAFEPWDRADDAACDAAGEPAAEEALEATGAALWSTYDRLLATPAPGLAAVGEKITWIGKMRDHENGVAALAECLRLHGSV